MDRRKFLSWAGLGWLGTRFAGVGVAIANLAGCGPKTVEVSKRPDGFVTIGSAEEFKKAGQLSIEESAIGPVTLIRDPANPAAVLAVNPTCTHQGCIVKWQGERQAFVCPCHGAKYGVDGKVLEGPAQKPLSVYSAKVEGQSVLVKPNSAS